MVSTIISGAICGLNVILIRVEVDMAQGLPGFMMVGYLSSEVKEAGERVRVALKNSGIVIPPLRITVNLSPADVRKGGTAFDLPIAVGMLQSLEHIEEALTDIMIVGELSLDGRINPIRGILPMVRKAKETGITRCLIPEENRAEGQVISGIEIIGASTLQEALSYLKGGVKEYPVKELQEKEIHKNSANKRKKETEKIPEKKRSKGQEKVRKEGRPKGQDKEWGNEQDKGRIRGKKEERGRGDEEEYDFSEISGQMAAKRAAEIAAAGFHNLLLIGPPGSGKTMIAKRLAGILPSLTMEESLEVSSLYSISGLLNSRETLVTKRPFMSPHHTVTARALVGGGRFPRPGIASLSHKGV